MLNCRPLALVLLTCCAAAAQAQPAVPAVPPARSTAAPRTAAPKAAAPATRAAPSPVIDPDAPPTSDVAPAGAPVAAATPAPPAPVAADAPPTSDAAPTSAVASAAPNTPAGAATPNTDAPAAPAAPAVPPTVARDYPITPEGNARFLAEYAARPDVKKLEGGTLYRVLQAAETKANGPIARGDTVTVSYRGWLINGTAFDQTKPGNPVLFTLNGVIPGWREALLKMKVGDLWEVAVPSDQAYGAEGRPGRIPPNQTLIFVISLAKVEYAG